MKLHILASCMLLAIFAIAAMLLCTFSADGGRVFRGSGSGSGSGRVSQGRGPAQKAGGSAAKVQ
jgi:hypothetical protein